MGVSCVGFRNCSVYPKDSNVNAPNPNPLNFIILDIKEIGSAVVAKILYLDCKNFEGVKICVFSNTTADEIRARKEIDPHFADDEKSPIARFKPTDDGIELALQLAYIIGTGE